jgi:hypothetical protein
VRTLLLLQVWAGCGRRCARASTATCTSCGRCSAAAARVSGLGEQEPWPAPTHPPAAGRARGGAVGSGGTPPSPGAAWHPTAARSDPPLVRSCRIQSSRQGRGVLCFLMNDETINQSNQAPPAIGEMEPTSNSAIGFRFIFRMSVSVRAVYIERLP